MSMPYGKSPSPYPAEANFFGALLDTAQQEYPLIEKENAAHATNSPPVAPGATVTIWVTVDVPKTAEPGNYSGTLRIEAEGEKPVSADIKLEVLPWTLPDTDTWRTWVELIQSPDTLAMEYELPLWSDRHWQMIARSLELIGNTSSRVIYVPLIAQTNNGNSESMVRWIRKSDGTFDYDFSIIDRYLDLARKHMGEPRVVVFEVWELYLVDKKRHAGAAGQQAAAIEYLEGRNALAESGPIVTLLDPQTGKTENLLLPHYDEEASRALWEPVFAALRQRMEKRGLTDAMMIGTMSDVVPTRSELDFFKDVTGNLPWVSHAHHPAPAHLAPIGYQTRVWNIHFSDYDPIGTRHYGWKGDLLMADYERHGFINQLSFTYWRHLGEFNITGMQRGIGRIGADFWSVIRDRNNRRVGTVASRYPQSSRRNLDIFASLLAPGPDGPVATPNYEIFREGIQECEARIFIENALTDEVLREKLGPDLADRCQTALDERLLAMWRGLSSQQLTGPTWHYLVWRGWANVAGHPWFMGSLWEDRTRTLFQLAAEVETALR